MIDGLSAEKLLSLNANVKNACINKTTKFNYFDEIIKESVCFSKVYGPGETFASLASKLTGDSLSKLRSDDWFNPKSFKSKNNIACFLKTKYCTNNIFYRNYSDKYPIDGVYARFNHLCTYGFDKYILKDESRIDLANSKEIAKYYDYFEFDIDKINENKFIFIHDLYLHDHPTAYESTNIKDYENGIFEAGNHVKENLTYLKFDKSSDILILSSDHGLTIRPNLNMFTYKSTTYSEYSQYKKSLYSELKIRSFLAIYSFGMKSAIIDSPITTQNVYNIVRNIIPFILNKEYNNIDQLTYQYKNKKILTSVTDLAYGNSTSLKLRQKFHAHIIFIKGINKWIYTRWPHREYLYVNLENPEELKNIKYSEIPIALKIYILKYYYIKSAYKRYFLDIFALKNYIKKVVITRFPFIKRFEKVYRKRHFS